MNAIELTPIRRSHQAEADRLFRQYLPLARELAWRFHTYYGRPIHEMIDEASSQLSLAICRWLTDYQQEAKAEGYGACTFLRRQVYYKLLDECSNRKKRPVSLGSLTPDDRSDLRETPAKPSRVERLLLDLGEDARTLVRTIIDAPGELIEAITPRRRVSSARRIRSYMFAQGWSAERLRLAWQEVSAAL